MLTRANLNYLASLAILLLHLAQSNSRAHSVSKDKQPQVILNEPTKYIVGVGSNLTLECSAHGTQPLVFVWFQDQKNGAPATATAAAPAVAPTTTAATATTTTTAAITTTATTNDQSDSPPSTELLEERRYEIQEDINENNITTSTLYLYNLKSSDTGIFLCWVENGAGHAIRNFSLIVTDLPAPQSYGLHAVVLLFVIVSLFVAIVIRHFYTPNSDDKVIKQKHEQQHLQQHHQPQQHYQPALHFHQHQPHQPHQSHQQYQQYHSQPHNLTNHQVDLDVLIEQMRSGIISLDHQSMSPVKEFNQPLSSHLYSDEVDDYGFLRPNVEILYQQQL